MICAKIRKGSFVYNKALGTELATVEAESSNAAETATVLLNEALIAESAIETEVLSVENTDDGRIKILIAVKNEDEIKTGEVMVNADL